MIHTVDATGRLRSAFVCAVDLDASMSKLIPFTLQILEIIPPPKSPSQTQSRCIGGTVKLFFFLCTVQPNISSDLIPRWLCFRVCLGVTKGFLLFCVCISLREDVVIYSCLSFLMKTLARCGYALMS
jgi:hypothetical protein